MKLNAQKVSEGVYLTANDFTQGKVSYANNNQKKYSLRLHEAFHGSTIKVIIGDSAITLKKGSIYGYRDQLNNSYRFLNNVAYKINNPSEKILLYSIVTTDGGHKSLHNVTRYYFSSNATAPLYPLTKWNLKTVLSEDLAFNKLVDVYFHSDDELIAYDTTSKMYQLNRVYDLSK
jgi:hypothetical protein